MVFGDRDIRAGEKKRNMKKSPLPLQNASGSSKNQSLGKEALVKLLRWHFGHPEFRGKQLEAIEAVLSGILCIFYLHFTQYGIELLVWSLRKCGKMFTADFGKTPFFVFVFCGLQGEIAFVLCPLVAGNPCVIRYRLSPRKPESCLLSVL